MDEYFLHYIWKFLQFDTQSLSTTQGERIQIFQAGHHNHDDGPDFSHARIKIDEVEWAGSVEIHLKSSDWRRHGHAQQPAYERVILHVVHEDDAPVVRQDGSMLPTLVLKGLFDSKLLDSYRSLSGTIDEIPCGDQIRQVDPMYMSSMINSMVPERITMKSEQLVFPLLEKTKGSWEEVGYVLLARALGMKVNADSFQELALSLPHKILVKHRHDPLQIEALVFGMAGFLEKMPKEKGGTHDHGAALRKEYDYLRAKYDLQPKIEKSHWRYARLRPANFPTVRLAQFAAILSLDRALLSQMIDAADFDQIKRMLVTDVSPYWQRHYDFGKPLRRTSKLGATAIASIVINALVPVLVSYGRELGRPDLVEKGLGWLEKLSAENNKITRTWLGVGIKARSAYESQGLIQLFHHYCTHKRCLDCQVGHQLVRSSR